MVMTCPMMRFEHLKKADLHLHTTASDGSYAASEVVRQALDVGMEWIAITDHDTVDGVADAMGTGQALGLPVLGGIELSTGKGQEVHLLGYGLDCQGAALKALLSDQLNRRRSRMAEMLSKLHVMGIEIDPAQVGSSQTAFMGRMNLAYAMAAGGYVASASEAFDRYLNPGKPAYVPRELLGVAEGIEALVSFGATVVMAHPGRLRMEEQSFTALLPGWIEAGLSGLEAYHASHDEATALRYDRMARRNGLLVTGGSDCHGRRDGAQIGDNLRYWRSVRADATALRERIDQK